MVIRTRDTWEMLTIKLIMHTVMYLAGRQKGKSLFLILLRAYSITHSYNNKAIINKHTEVIPSDNYLNKITLLTLNVAYM